MSVSENNVTQNQNAYPKDAEINFAKRRLDCWSFIQSKTNLVSKKKPPPTSKNYYDVTLLISKTVYLN